VPGQLAEGFGLNLATLVVSPGALTLIGQPMNFRGLGASGDPIGPPS